MGDPNKPADIDAAVARLWNENAKGWAESLHAGKDEFRTLVQDPSFERFVGDVRGKRVLDAGCGEGESSRILARSGAKVVGIDISDAMLDLAKAEEAKNPLGIEYRNVSMADLSVFADGSFDHAVSIMALMNSSQLAKEFREFFRVLRPSGTFSVCVRHPCFLTQGMRIVAGGPGGTPRLLVGEYFRETPWKQTLPLGTSGGAGGAGSFTAMRFPYTLSSYIDGMIAAGFTLVRIEEPRPEAADTAGRPWLAFWREQAALYLFLKGAKPERR